MTSYQDFPDRPDAAGRPPLPEYPAAAREEPEQQPYAARPAYQVRQQDAVPQPGAGWDPQPAARPTPPPPSPAPPAPAPGLQPVPPPQIGAPWEPRTDPGAAPGSWSGPGGGGYEGRPGTEGSPGTPGPYEPRPGSPAPSGPVPGAEPGFSYGTGSSPWGTEPQLVPTRLDVPALHDNPAGYFGALRLMHGTVAPVLLEGDLPAWLVLGYREVHYVLANPGLFGRDSRRWHSWHRVPQSWPLLPQVAHNSSVLFTEGDAHRRRAGAIADVLAGADQFELRLAAERAADAAIDWFAGAGRAELVADYAGQVPLRVMAALLGLHEDETAELATDVALSFDDGPEAAAACARTRNTMEVLLERARRRPGPEIPARLLAHPATLDEEQIVQDLLALVTIGQQLTAQWIGNALRLMLTDDRFAVTLSGGRRSVGQALTEVLWTETPAQLVIGRWATRDTQLGGRLVRQGDCLVLGLAAANTDPAVCPYAAPGLSQASAAAPGAVANQAHLSFGHGEHRCPAPAPEIAEITAKAAIEVLLDRLPDLHLSVPDSEVRPRPSLWLRGPAALPVEFTPV
ncbi:cytochrome P450 [Actinacidiphila acididurans]|uniref:Cytochrome P450 n=1 Tax=Actinacidiphila acididurans TaxID=2784346 RepID=A0ABS2TU93_9ACTN|nr:cytochrome P450 [Actinacidiphila acididurans]MBM9505865.1 cytochrome P450 [Actinacidiphila acididurans]